ncbi:MAG TPA: HEAT repeat domain-containing protein [Propionicimonas sp.]|jgi:HEAT repeat protein|uniref:HEAT repeat domain-containing protein n=1 Tax=Propionicimonas sp. TaxID=1955623 RepID=UPI002F42BE34
MSRTWRIGEVAERTGLTRRTLRHYDELGLLVPSGRSWGDYRLYDEGDLLRLLQIQSLKALGLSLPEVAGALADPAMNAAATLRSHLAHLEDRIEAEGRLADRLRTLAGADERSWEDVLEAISLTQDLAHPDPIVRLRAALQSPGSSTGELLPALTAEKDPAVQEVLVWALARQPDAGTAAIGLLDSPDAGVRSLMVRLLGKVRDPGTAPAVAAALGDPDPHVVNAAVNALGRLGDPESIPALAERLGSPEVKQLDLIEALAGFGAQAVPAVAERLAAGNDDTRAHAAEALGRLGSADAIPALAAALADDDRAVRLAALLALGELGPEAHPAMEEALDDPTVAGVARRLLDLHAT